MQLDVERFETPEHGSGFYAPVPVCDMPEDFGQAH
jgi:hypothetical protein